MTSEKLAHSRLAGRGQVRGVPCSYGAAAAGLCAFEKLAQNPKRASSLAPRGQSAGFLLSFGARLLLVLAMLVLPLGAAEDWGPVQFLAGRWTGEGGGGPGQGAGSFSFEPDLQGKVLVRKNLAEYPPANGKPGFRHDDLTIVYREGGQLKAIYFDSEAHVIRYDVKGVEGGVAFVTEAGASGPRYRLTYTSSGKDALKIKFD